MSGEPAAMRRWMVRLCVAIPVAVLALSYLWLAIAHGTPFLWSVIVHESGRYTFGQTVLYFSHFLREVPIAIVYALFLLSASGASAAGGDRKSNAVAWICYAAAGALIAGALLLTARADGFGSAFQDLLQYRTRDDLAGYGTHWHYHWLSTLWFGAVAAVAPAALHRITGVPILRVSRFWTRAAWIYFAGVTIIFGLSADIFLDARYAGHQAREILTHAPVTALLGMAALLIASRRVKPPPHSLADTGRSATIRMLLGLVLLVPPYLAAVALRGDVMAQGQSAHGLGAMIAAHYFEHTLDYLLVLLLLTGGLVRRSARHQPMNRNVASATSA